MGRCSTPNSDTELLVQEDAISKPQLSQKHLTSPEGHESPASLALTVEPEEPELEYRGNKIALELVAELKDSEKQLSLAEAYLAQATDISRYWEGVVSKQRNQRGVREFAAERKEAAGYDMRRAKSSITQSEALAKPQPSVASGGTATPTTGLALKTKTPTAEDKDRVVELETKVFFSSLLMPIIN
jgi:hypothetical protein